MSAGKAWSIARKDLRSEVRSREGVTTMVFLSLMILFVFRAILDPRIGDRDPALVAGVLWATFYFAGTVAVAGAYARERDRGTLEGLVLSPGGAFAVYLGKLTATAAVTLGVNSLSLLFLGVLFSYDFGSALGLVWLVMVAGTLGFLSVGSVLSAMVRGARSREALFTILLIPPTLFSIVMPSVGATATLLGGSDAVAPHLSLLLSATAVYVALAYLLFPYVLEE